MIEMRDSGFDVTSTIINQIGSMKINKYGTIWTKDKDYKCLIDKRIDVANVHSIRNIDGVGKASIMLSYVRRNVIGEYMDTLVGYF